MWRVIGRKHQLTTTFVCTADSISHSSSPAHGTVVRWLFASTLTLIWVQVDYTEPENDPVGSVSIFKRQRSTKTYREPCEVDFDKFDKPYRTNTLVGRGMRVGGADFTTFSMVRLFASY